MVKLVYSSYMGAYLSKKKLMFKGHKKLRIIKKYKDNGSYNPKKEYYVIG